MDRAPVQEDAMSIINAHKLKFDDTAWQYNLQIDDNEWRRMSFKNIHNILYKSEYAEARDAFIEKLENPVEFVNSTFTCLLPIPKELKLRAAMKLHAGGE